MSAGPPTPLETNGGARDVLFGLLQYLAAALELVFIPNAAGVNLNRDFVLLNQPKSRALDWALRH